MNRAGACVLLMLICVATSAQDADVYQQVGQVLREAVDALAAAEVAQGRFHATAWGPAQTHIAIYLSAWRVTGDPKYLDYARVPADWLIAARQPSRGYAHSPFIHHLGSDDTFPAQVTFRDARDRSAVQAILSVYDATGDEKYLEAARATADFLLAAQFDCGAWPSVWPRPERYWTGLPMLNDYVTISQTQTLMAVYRRSGDERYLDAIRRAGDFFVHWQLPEPAPGWAQQYSLDGRPAWGRVFEPPSVCGLPTAHAIGLLIDIYLLTDQARYLQPIPAALAWLQRSRTGPREWARFYEPYTGRPIYARSQTEPQISYTREVLYPGYAQFGDWGVDGFAARWRRLQELGREGLIAAESAPPSADELRRRIADLEPRVRALIAPDGALGGYPANDANLSALAGAVSQATRYLEAVRALEAAEG